jgi:hydrogenase maturation protease
MASACPTDTAVVIGYGNPLRGDDGAGPEVAAEVARLGLPGVRALAVPQLTPELAEALAGARLAVFVDAWMGPKAAAQGVWGRSAPNAVEALSVQAVGRPAFLGHTCDPGSLLALAEAVYGTCPPAWIIHIPAFCFPFGAGLSPGARRGATAAIREVVRLVTPAAPR